MAQVQHRLCSDSELISLMKKRDELALEEIYDRYWYLLFTSAFNLINSEQAAKDLVQELFISLWKKIDEKEIDHLKSYLLQSLKYRAFMYLRKRYTSQKHLQRIKLLSKQQENTTEQTINLHQTQEQLDKSVKQLPARCREVFLLSRYEHLSNEQIAMRMNISVKTVENQMTKALKLLRVSLKYLVVVVAGFFV